MIIILRGNIEYIKVLIIHNNITTFKNIIEKYLLLYWKIKLFYNKKLR